MAEHIKKSLWLLLFAFLAYAMFANPNRSGAAVHGAWDSLSDGVHNIGKFFQSALDNSK